MPAAPTAASPDSLRTARLAGLLAAAAPAPELCTCEGDRPTVTEKVTVGTEKVATVSPASNHDHLGHNSTAATRAALLRAARLLLGGNVSLFRGPLAVVVKSDQQGMRLRVVPTVGADGIGEPSDQMGTGSGSSNLTERVTPSVDAALLASLPPGDVLRSYLSPEECRILRVLAQLPAGRTLTGTTVLRESCIPKSHFWSLWSNLQQRGLVLEVKGPRAGFMLGCDWVRPLLG